MQAEALVKQGKPAEALQELQRAARAEPANAKHRVFLFQLLSVLGDWDRALTQLNVAADLDAKTLLMAQVCRPALASEALRQEIFAGQRSPLVFGEPAPWVGWMIEALRATSQGEYGRAAELRSKAMEAAPGVAGTIDGQPFEWIADADMRLGPILEAVIDGRYFWVPLQHIRAIDLEAPADLRDLVWLPARFTWSNGGTGVGLIPARYPGSESSPDGGIQMARKTEWAEPVPGLFTGLGQRLFATDQGEHALLQTRRIVLGEAPPEGPAT